MTYQSASAPGASVAERLDRLDWPDLHGRLESDGFARLGPVLSADDCKALRNRFDDDVGFSERVPLAQAGYGVGELKVLETPLPPVVQSLRAACYAHLAPLAERWAALLQGVGGPFPPSHEAFLALCRDNGQHVSGPALLSYGVGGHIGLHQDSDGGVVFPFQFLCLLSEPENEFEGGIFTLVEERPDGKLVPEPVPLRYGEAVVFTSHQRPDRTKTGVRAVNIRHGASRIRAGRRYSLSIVFHNYFDKNLPEAPAVGAG